MDERILRVFESMKTDFDAESSLDELAEHLNLSPAYLRRMFKAEIGMPPNRYLKGIRMQRAKELLETSFLRIKEIMFRVGMSDESHFVRDFKRTYGQTPTQYRASALTSAFDHAARSDRLTNPAN